MKTQFNHKVWQGVASVCALWFLFLIVHPANAQTRLSFAPQNSALVAYGSHQRPSDTRRPQVYDVTTVETQRGSVVSIDRISTTGRAGGIHLTLDIGNEPLLVHLGPAWYLEDQSFDIVINDVIEVTGSRVVIDDEPVLIAAEIRIGDTVITLRDRDGIPLWPHHHDHDRQGPRQSLGK